MGLAHNFTINNILSYVSALYGLRTSQQCDLHPQTSLFDAGFSFYCPIAFGCNFETFSFFTFYQLFFHIFQNWNFLIVCIFFIFMCFITLKLIFSKFGMYLTYKNWFWGHRFGQGIYSTVWSCSESKIKKQVMFFFQG